MQPKKPAGTGFQFKLPPGYIPPPPPGKPKVGPQPSLVASVMSSLQPNAYGFTLTNPARSIQKPAPKSHPLSFPSTGNPAFAPRFVDKSNGLLASLMGNAVMPVGLQDWVNRVYTTVDAYPAAIRAKADTVVKGTVMSMLQSGELWKLHWITYPVPPLREFVPQSEIPNKRPMDVICLDGTDHAPPTKAPKSRDVTYKPPPAFTEDYISLAAYSDPPRQVRGKQPKRTPGYHVLPNEDVRKRSERAEKYKVHLSASTDTQLEVDNSNVNVKYEFGNDEDDVFEKTEQYSVIGLCKTMEKRYLRLTAAPDPTLVRPEPVLKKWLIELTRMWSNREREWKYIEDQLRAIRQDLTVQNQRGPFTRQVYETNARWALESGDMGQFNQCQTQLKRFHEEVDLKSAPASDIDTVAEFVSYRLLYYYFQYLHVDEQIFLSQILGDPVLAQHRFVRFALEIRKHATTGNFCKYFKMCREADKQCTVHMKYLLDVFTERQRVHALIVLTKAFVTQLSIAWLMNVLAFESEDACRSFLESHGAVMKLDSTAIDPRASFPVFSASALVTGTKAKFMG